ncbi:MAG: 50S ribosomal protein L16 [Victivallales bacterium]|jgi:large subunit ribosomal protein L16|nr:50S ribosomal protein L16 [Victivallales bacterium]MBT7163240.1 50S ribosomal protein L16 [Victivallales bacterium]MBT7299357.1 50S ribosomal protein L16 [Victivallales bacterium]
MPLMPKRVKHRKVQRGHRGGNATSSNKLDFGDYGLQILERGMITANQIEAARVAATRHMQRRGKLWIRLFPDKPISKKPLETRMGKGKGNPEGWVAVVRPGNMVIEISGCNESTARAALARAASKMPYRCRFLTRHRSA